MTTYLTKRGKVACLIFAVAILALIIPLTINWNYAISDRRDFKSTYGVHIYRAANLNDAQMIKDSLELALQGIQELGLSPTDSYRILWFTDTEFSRVQTQMMNIESVILASDEVISWLNDMHGASTTKEIGTDIYNEKLKNVQAMVDELQEKEYRIERAWLIKYKRGWLIMYWIPWLVIPFGIVGCLVLFTGDCTKRAYDIDDREQFKKANKLWI